MPTHTPLRGPEIVLEPDADMCVEVDPAHEHAVLVDAGPVWFDCRELGEADLGCRDAGPRDLWLRAGPDGARLVVLGGEPFRESIVMWWNFVARDHDEVAVMRAAWESGADLSDGEEWFGAVAGYTGTVRRLPAPPLPAVRLLPRGVRHRPTPAWPAAAVIGPFDSADGRADLADGASHRSDRSERPR